MTQVDTILAHGTLITMDAAYTLIADGAVAIKDEAIVALGPTDDFCATTRPIRWSIVMTAPLCPA